LVAENTVSVSECGVYSEIYVSTVRHRDASIPLTGGSRMLTGKNWGRGKTRKIWL